MKVTQQEFVQRIEEMSRQMAQAWHMEQRVKALKIVIQVCALMFKSHDDRCFVLLLFFLHFIVDAQNEDCWRTISR